MFCLGTGSAREGESYQRECSCVRTWALAGVRALARVHVTARLTCMFTDACVCKLVCVTACVHCG